MTLAIDLTGQRALVSGAGSGIGLACARMLAQAGAAVIASDVDGDAASAAAAAIAGDVCAERLDVSSWDACRELAARHTDQPIGVLVNCAATWTLGPFTSTDPDRWHRDLAVTLHGPMLLSRALLPTMAAHGRGSIVNIGSDAGRIGEPKQVAYSAAKGGVIAFTKALAREAGRHGVRVNCVSPGLTRTPASAGYIDALDPTVVRRTYPLGRLGEPEDVAALVTFLASDLASWITGQIISVNGGYTTTG